MWNERKEFVIMREKILTFIEKNSRIDLKELAIILGVDEASVVNELQKMEEEHIICGYHTLIDWDKAGRGFVNALIEVRVTPQRERGFDHMADRIVNYPEVTAVYLISGSYDYLVSIDGKTLMEVSRFVSEKLSTLEGVVGTVNLAVNLVHDHASVVVKEMPYAVLVQILILIFKLNPAGLPNTVAFLAQIVGGTV